MEDLIEELVGEIADEYDREAADVEKLAEGRYRVAARMATDELGDLFDIELDDDDVDSVGGLLTKTLGRLPVAGSTATGGRAAAHGRPDGWQASQDQYGDRRARSECTRARAGRRRTEPGDARPGGGDTAMSDTSTDEGSDDAISLAHEGTDTDSSEAPDGVLRMASARGSSHSSDAPTSESRP